jgi:hypothetical protein
MSRKSTSLMTPTEARERWPEEFYDADTFGGMQRDIIIRAWELAEELAAKIAGTPAERLAEEVIEGFLAKVAADQERIDELQEEGLREAFQHIMGYELPEVSDE